MRTTRQTPAKKAGNKAQPVKKFGDSLLVGHAKHWAEAVHTVSPQLIAQLIHTPEDLTFLQAWYRFGQREAKAGHFPPTLKQGHLVVSPFGVLCLAALASGWLGDPVAWMVQSTTPPRSDAS